MRTLISKLFFFSFLISQVGYSVQEYYSIAKSIRALGMGNAFYGLSDDENALFYNPAGLAGFRGKGEFNFAIKADTALTTLSAIGPIMQNLSSTTNLITALTAYSGQPIYAGVSLFPYYLRKNFAIGLLMPDIKSNITLLGSDIDTTADITAIADAGLVAGYAMTFIEKLRVGITGKALYRMGGTRNYTMVDLISGTPITLANLGGGGGGIDFDIGATYELPELPWGIWNRVGFSLNNLLATTFPIMPFPNMSTPPGLPRMLSFGTHTVFKGWGPFDNFHVMLDFSEFGIGGETDINKGARGGSFFKHLNLGFEVPVKGWFIVRAGIHQGNLTAGMGIRVPFMKLDLATYAAEDGGQPGSVTSRRFALLLTLGGGSPSQPPILTAKPTQASEEEKDKEKAKDREINSTNINPAADDLTFGLDEWMDDLP